MIRGPAGGLRINPFEPKFRQIKPANKNVDNPNRIVLANPVFQAFGKQRALLAINALNEAAHSESLRKSRRNHTARIKSDRPFLHNQDPTQTV
jgi:hypothetical protein